MGDSLKAMDRQLADAARTGDVRFLKRAVADCKSKNDYSYFLSRYLTTKGRDGTIFHLSTWHEQVGFCKQAMESLPREVVQRLLSHQEPLIGWQLGKTNALHTAAYLGRLRIVKLIIGFYKSLPPSTSSENNSNDDTKKNHNVPSVEAEPKTTEASEAEAKTTAASEAEVAAGAEGSPPGNNNMPWLARDSKGRTPLHLALEKEKLECALEILSMDESVSTMDDNDGNSPLFLAVDKGYTQVALQILNSDHPYSVSGKEGSTPLHLVVNCSEEVCRRLLERHPQLLKARDPKQLTVMQKWLEISVLGTVWPFEYLLKSDNKLRTDALDLILAIDEDGDNLLHFTATYKEPTVAKILVEAYEQERVKEASNCLLEGLVPWLRQNNDGKTPLDMGIEYDDAEEVALCFLTPEINSVLQGKDNPLFRAIQGERYKVAEGIVDKQNVFGWSTGLTSGRGRNVLHAASTYEQEIAKWLVNKLPHFISMPDEDGKTPLHEASEAGADWLIELMLKTNHFSLKEASASKKAPLAWVEACKKGHLSTVHAFINNCAYFRDHCLEHHDTPLHHVILRGYTEYKDFLEIPIIRELKYIQDSDGETPLHRAVMNDNIVLAETLLTMQGKDWRIKNNSDKTALDLLAQKCTQSQNWDRICKRVGINPTLRMTYVQHETSLLDMRSTLSVVAALLATITFTAGFTLPGGFDGNTGQAILAKNAVFLVFLMSDTYAMCCSMLVLFCLIWSMVSDHNKSLLLIDRGMVILLQSLYGTLVAFMTGVATVIFHKSLWAAIVIFVMCCLIGISATVRVILFQLLDKLVPSANENGFQNRVLQLAEALKCIGATRSRSVKDPASMV